MKQIRKGTFETNSSSVHSLSISVEGREPNKLPINKEGYIEISFGTFGKNLELYSTQIEKLSYLMTCCWYISNVYSLEDLEDFYSNYTFKCIEEEICNYTGAKGIIMRTDIDPEIDHQSIPHGDIDIIDIYDSDAVIDFVFNKYVALKTDCD